MSETNFSNLPSWLPRHLKRTGLTPEKLGHRAKISRTTVYRYMYDENRPTAQTMLRICRVLGVPFEEGMGQYTPKKNGRPYGSDSTSDLKVRKR
jgi:transcriptional regulator with XRE-family HTH domain